MANRYAKNVTGNWSATSSWSATGSGGVDSVSVPTNADDVIFDAGFTGNISVDVTCVCKTLTQLAGATGTLTHNSQTLAISGNCTFISTMTYTGSSHTISFNTSATFISAGKLLCVLRVTGVGTTLTIGDDLNFNTQKGLTALNINSPANVNLNGKTVKGNSATNRVSIKSDTAGTGGTITVNGGTFTNANFTDMTFNNGGADLHLEAITGLSGDCQGNSMTGGGVLTFTTPVDQHWVNDLTGNWSDSTKWTSRVPLPQDNVFFDRSFTSRAITMDMPQAGKTIDWSGASGTVNWGTSQSPAIYGSMDLTNLTTLQAIAFTMSGRGNYTIKSAGKTFGSNMNITAPNGTYSLSDAYTNVGNLTINYGSFTTNNYTVTCSKFTDGTSTASILTLGTSTINLTNTTTGIFWNTSVAITLSAASSTINILNTTNTIQSFYGYTNQVFGNINITANPAGGSVSFFYNISFNNFVVNAPNIISGNVGYTMNFNNPVFRGSPGKMIVWNMAPQTTSGANTILNYTGSNIVNCDYLQVQGVNVTPANKWYWGTNERGIGLDFKGQTASGDYVTAPNSATANQIYGSTSFSIEAWALTRTIGSTAGRVMDKGIYNIASPSTSTFTFSGGNVSATSTGFTYGALTHYVSVWNGTTLTLYINGVAGTPIATSGTPSDDTARYLIFGNTSTRDRTDDGIIYATRIYRNKALSAGEVTTAYNAGAKALLPVSGCTSQYMFNEGTGSTLTDSVNAVNGTITGAGWTTNWKNKLGLNFRGQAASGDAVTVENSATANQIYGATSFSWEFWFIVRTSNTGASGVVRLIDKSGNGTTGYIFYLSAAATIKSLIDDGSFRATTTSTTFGYNQLNHVVFSWTSGQAVKIYLNGVECSYLTNVAITTPSTDAARVLILGNQLAGTLTFDGVILATRIYRNKALSLSDVVTAYYAGPKASLPVSGCTSQYLFNEGTGSTLTDSVNAVNGTISGAVWSNLQWGDVGQDLNSLWLGGD